MKKNIINNLFFFFLAMGLSSCGEEDVRGITSMDNIPPEAVSEIEVTNLPGGAKIEYKIPDDEDVLFVEAKYKLDNGEAVSTKSSVFRNYVMIEGLRKTKPQDVELVVVDRSNNRSVSSTVSITPETAPIDDFFSTLKLTSDFGGVRAIYNNENDISVELLLHLEDANGNMIYQQSAYIEDGDETYYIFRTFPPKTAKFGIFSVDRWGNTTEMQTAELTPLEEELLDLEKFKDITLNGDEGDAWGWIKTNMWDGNIESGFHTAQGQPGVLIPPYTDSYQMFTVDLGVTAKLSRFKFWQRQGGWAYTHGNPRYFEVWGTDKLPTDNGDSFDGWTRLIENGEVIKPSGAPLGTNTDQDLEASAAGEEFDFPIDAPPVRYIRFVNIQNWAGSKFLHVMELNFWGQVKE